MDSCYSYHSDSVFHLLSPDWFDETLFQFFCGNSKAGLSGYPPSYWTWTPIPDEQIAEIGKKDTAEKIADLSTYGIENHNVIAMSQRSCIEYLSEDNDFNGVILIAKPENEDCKSVMQTYCDVAETETDVKFYYVSLDDDDYAEVIRTVLASTLPRDGSAKPVMKLPLVPAVNGDQVVDYQNGINNSDGNGKLDDQQKTKLGKRYIKLSHESRDGYYKNR